MNIVSRDPDAPPLLQVVVSLDWWFSIHNQYIIQYTLANHGPEPIEMSRLTKKHCYVVMNFNKRHVHLVY